jgi:hypothetical protein
VGGECLAKSPQVHIDELLLQLDLLDSRTNDARMALLEENKEDNVVRSAKVLGYVHEGLHGM